MALLRRDTADRVLVGGTTFTVAIGDVVAPATVAAQVQLAVQHNKVQHMREEGEGGLTDGDGDDTNDAEKEEEEAQDLVLEDNTEWTLLYLEQQQQQQQQLLQESQWQ